MTRHLISARILFAMLVFLPFQLIAAQALPLPLYDVPKKEASQDKAPTSDGWMEDFLQKIGADGEFNPDKAIDISVLPGPFYNPEMSLGVGVSAIGLYQVDPNDTVSELSSLIINGFASVNGSVGVVIENKTFLNEDRQRFYFNIQLTDAPDVYYGVGYTDNHVDDNKIDYNYQQFSANPMWLQRLNDKSFAGIGFDFNYSSGGHFDSADSSVDYSELAESSRSVGANILINYDSRDYVLNPSDGRLLQMNSYLYRQFLGSKTDFEVYDLMYSEYMPIAGYSDVLAWQVRTRLTHGDVPWDQLSKVGGGNLLRGYNIGRYRDKQMLLAQVEYRMDLTGRHGMVFWSGIGMVAEQIGDFSSDEILPSNGLGYRFEVKPRVNLRLDLAFANSETGFYFNVNEAF